jgi:hypothetical protein
MLASVQDQIINVEEYLNLSVSVQFGYHAGTENGRGSTLTFPIKIDPSEAIFLGEADSGISKRGTVFGSCY